MVLRMCLSSKLHQVLGYEILSLCGLHGLKREQLNGTAILKQLDILISKNQELRILYLKHLTLNSINYHGYETSRNPQKFDTNKINNNNYGTIQNLTTQLNTNISNNWPPFLVVNNGYTSSYTLIRTRY